jgi:hypothetical protein
LNKVHKNWSYQYSLYLEYTNLQKIELVLCFMWQSFVVHFKSQNKNSKEFFVTRNIVNINILLSSFFSSLLIFLSFFFSLLFPVLFVSIFNLVLIFSLSFLFSIYFFFFCLSFLLYCFFLPISFLALTFLVLIVSHLLATYSDNKWVSIVNLGTVKPQYLSLWIYYNL